MSNTRNRDADDIRSSFDIIFEFKPDLNLTSNYGDTPLTSLNIRHPGISNRQSLRVYIIQKMVQLNADIHAIDAAGNSLLHMSFSDMETDYLISLGLNDLQMRNSQGQTPLISAVIGNNTKNIGTFLRNGSDVNAQDYEGYSSLHYLVSDPEITQKNLKILLQNGANPNIRNNNGATPLHTAAVSGCKSGIKILLEYGADLSIQDIHGRNPIDFLDSAECEYYDINAWKKYIDNLKSFLKGLGSKTSHLKQNRSGYRF